MEIERARSRASRFLRQLGPITADGLVELISHRRAHALTLLGIVWGSASVVLLLALGSGFNQFLDLGVEKTGDRWTAVQSDYTTAESEGARPGRQIQFTTEDVERLSSSVASARAVAGEILELASVESTRRTRATVVSASSPDIAVVQNHRVARGRFYDARDEREGRHLAVLGATLAEIFFGADDPLGQAIQIDGIPFEVIGVLEPKGFQLMTNGDLHDRIVFVPLSSGRLALGYGRRVSHFYLEPYRLEDSEAMRREVRSLLWDLHHLPREEEDAVKFFSVPEFLGPVYAIGIALQILLGLVGTVALGMAAVGVANLMIAIVHTRRIEFAVRRACGARRSDITIQLVFETTLVVLAGGVLGVLLGVFLGLLMNVLPLPPDLPAPRVAPSVVATTFAVLAGVGVAAGIGPARVASRVEPGVALRVT